MKNIKSSSNYHVGTNLMPSKCHVHKTEIICTNFKIACSSSSSSFRKVLFSTKAQIALLICILKKIATKARNF